MKKPMIEYYDNGQKWYEIYYNDKGEYHREDGPAYNIWYKNGQKLIEEYWINGEKIDKFQLKELKLEKFKFVMNNPEIKYYTNGQKWYEIYRNNEGFCHRENKPAVITYYINGQIKSEEYWINGNIHREDDSAKIYWYNNGQKQFEEYWINSKTHREDGPAYISWYENGQIEYEVYYINGKLHRDDGPAKIYWYNNGQKEYEEYYINGEKIDKFKIRKLKLEKLKLL